MKLILILCSEDKQKADSPCEEIRISGVIENEAKAYKAFRSQKCKELRSRSVSFRSQNVSFRSQSVSFRPRSVPFRANRSAFLWCSSTLQGLYKCMMFIITHNLSCCIFTLTLPLFLCLIRSLSSSISLSVFLFFLLFPYMPVSVFSISKFQNAF